MKLATWNVNSLNVRLPQVLDWLAANPVDVLCIQELKLTDDKFPEAAFKEAGYHAVWACLLYTSALPGRGVSGKVDGVVFQLGNRRLMRELGVSDAKLEARLDELEQQGKSAIALSDGQRVLALAAVADTVKPTSAAAIADLHALGVRTLMLTGDNTPTAQAIARQVGTVSYTHLDVYKRQA